MTILVRKSMKKCYNFLSSFVEMFSIVIGKVRQLTNTLDPQHIIKYKTNLKKLKYSERFYMLNFKVFY